MQSIVLEHADKQRSKTRFLLSAQNFLYLELRGVNNNHDKI